MTDVRTRALGVVADVLMSDGCGDSDQCDKTAARVLSALTAAGLVIEQGWQTMDSAPRDGTYFDAWIPPCLQAPNGTATRCCWHLGCWYHAYFTEPTHWRADLAPPETTP